jgi:hypothetical protein
MLERMDRDQARQRNCLRSPIRMEVAARGQGDAPSVRGRSIDYHTAMLTLGRPYAPAAGSPAPWLGLFSGVLGVMAGIFWAVGRGLYDATVELTLMSMALLVPLGLGWFFRHLGAVCSAVAPASAAVCLGVVAWLGVERPLIGHDHFVLGWLVTLLVASVTFAWSSSGRASTPSVAFALAPDFVVENDGVQWLLFVPSNKLGVGNNEGFMLLLENCHDHERRVTVDVREIGTALIGGRDRVERASVDVALPALGFAAVRHPLVVAGDGPPTVYLWVDVRAKPRGLRGRSKPRNAPTAERYRPMLTALLNKRMPDPRQLGFAFLVDAAKQATAEPSAYVQLLDETQLRERFSQS